MSVASITARIAEIQGQLALLAPPTTSYAGSVGGTTAATGTGTSTGTSTTASDFAAALGRATTAASPGLTVGSTTSGGTTGEQVVAKANEFLGMPYVWGGDDPSEGGLDCSGLVQHVYEQFGIDLPRVSADQARAGVAVPSLSQAQPGDLIAWDNSSRNNGADHIAIYIGGGKMIEAPRPGGHVQLVDVPSEPDYIRRVLPTGGGEVATPVADAAGVAGRVAGTTPYADLFAQAGARYGVDPSLLSAVAATESSYDPRAVSHAGAQGLMQLMPGTAQGLGVTDPFDPAQAVDGAARLLHDLLGRFGRTDLALAAYNAGPGAVLRYDGIPPYAETQNYVRKVLAHLEGSAA